MRGLIQKWAVLLSKGVRKPTTKPLKNINCTKKAKAVIHAITAKGAVALFAAAAELYNHPILTKP